MMLTCLILMSMLMFNVIIVVILVFVSYNCFACLYPQNFVWVAKQKTNKPGTKV